MATPTKGIHDWIGSIDINSLYPSVIRALNMGPETIVGQIRPVITSAEINRAKHAKKSFAAAWDSQFGSWEYQAVMNQEKGCLLYTSPSPRDRQKSRMPSSA